jgi:hypothetical protein
LRRVYSSPRSCVLLEKTKLFKERVVIEKRKLFKERVVIEKRKLFKERQSVFAFQ